MRAYIEHGMHALPGNVKLYYMGPMFRRERPQKGRYRQFYQIGAEVLGQSDAPAIDAEVLGNADGVFQARRTDAHDALHQFDRRQELPPAVCGIVARRNCSRLRSSSGRTSQRRIETNPLRVLDSKLPHEQEIIAKLPRIADHLCAACREHFAKLKDELKLRGIAYRRKLAAGARPGLLHAHDF